MALHIPVLYGTMREGRKSEPAAKLIQAEAMKRGIDSPFVTPEQFRGLKTLEKNPPAEWKSIMEKADGLIIVTPEYNHGYPGSLKEMLDALYVEYHHKPIGICGAGGYSGGMRVVEQLRQVAIELHMAPIREALYFPMVWTAFNEDGSFKEAETSYKPRFDAFFKDLTWWAQVLKEGRANHP